MTQPDVRVYQDGSIVTLQPTNKWARLWIEDNCAAESWQWLGDALAIDYRFAEDVVAAMVEDGFEVSHV